MKILVVCGGNSKEREISIKSGKAVFNALKDVYETELKIIENINDLDIQSNYDALFLALHGGFGESGEIQKKLEEYNIAFTGPGSDSSMLCLDKLKSLELLVQNQIPTPKYMRIIKNKINSAFIKASKYVLIPQSEGSSIGVTIALENELETVIATYPYEQFILEEYIPGRELTVGYLGDKLLPIVEIVYDGDIFDYDKKYKDPNTKYIVPAQLDDKTIKKINRYCEKIIDIFDLEHLARIDIRLDKDNNPFVLEINTIPGFTDRSLVPMAAQSIGISYAQTCKILIGCAIARNNKKINCKTSQMQRIK